MPVIVMILKNAATPSCKESQLKYIIWILGRQLRLMPLCLHLAQYLWLQWGKKLLCYQEEIK